MSVDTCTICADNGHLEGDIIWVDDKPFCPNTLTRIWTEEEAEEMSDEELAKAKTERIKLVRPSKYVIVKEVSKD